jgi:hypothetical protein
MGIQGNSIMSIVNDFQVNGLFPSVVSANVSTVQYFPRLLGTSIGVQSVAPSATSAAGQLVVPGNNEVNGQQFNVILGASFLDGSGDPSATAKLSLYANTGTVTSPVYTLLGSATTTAPTLAGAQDIALEFKLFGTTQSGVLQGTYSGTQNGNAVAGTEITNLTGINFGLATPFGLVAAATFGTANAGNKASLYQFQISIA